LYDLALERLPQQIRRDHLAAIVRHVETARPGLAGDAVDLDLGDDGNAGLPAHRIGDAAAGQHVPVELLAWADMRLPSGLLCHCLDQRKVARMLEVAQAELHRVGVGGMRQLIDKRLDSEVNLWTERIAEMRCAQR